MDYQNCNSRKYYIEILHGNNKVNWHDIFKMPMQFRRAGWRVCARAGIHTIFQFSANYSNWTYFICNRTDCVFSALMQHKIACEHIGNKMLSKKVYTYTETLSIIGPNLNDKNKCTYVVERHTFALCFLSLACFHVLHEMQVLQSNVLSHSVSSQSAWSASSNGMFRKLNETENFFSTAVGVIG